MIRDGQKWACESCIRGHRVSSCNHSDRELKLIAPKGRPVKQCEHCRSARKDKSHHAKCDCGNKTHKESPESEPKLEIECCCHMGTDCVCGIKSEMADMRHETITRRRTMPVKSKPVLTTNISDPGLTNLTTGHHKQHKPVYTTHGQALVTPYPKPIRSSRPASIHNPSYAGYMSPLEYSQSSRSADDMSLLESASNKVYGNNPWASVENLDYLSDFTNTGFDFQNVGNESDGSQISRTTSAENVLSISTGWFDNANSLPTVNETPGDYSNPSSGVFGDLADNEWTIPSASSISFSPADLPLVSGLPIDFSQTVSHSGESNYQSAPGLTASSSGAQSEVGDFVEPRKQEPFPHWSGTVPILDSYRQSSASSTNDYAFGQSLPTSYETNATLKRKSPQRHRQTYSSGSNTNQVHAHNLSDSTGSTISNPNVEVNIGHLQNLAAQKNHHDAMSAHQSSISPGYPPISDDEYAAITIPADESINDDWYFSSQSVAAQAAQQSREFSWLLDGA